MTIVILLVKQIFFYLRGNNAHRYTDTHRESSHPLIKYLSSKMTEAGQAKTGSLEVNQEFVFEWQGNYTWLTALSPSDFINRKLELVA